MALHTASICAGYDGIALGLALAGADPRVVVYVEREAYAVANLAAAMDEGRLDPAPIWSDVATFDGRPWRGVLDLITAGIPCQPYSVAGARRAGDDPRDLVGHLARIVGEARPALVLVENVPDFVSLGGLRRLGEALEGVGYRLADPVLCAASDAGAPHRRQRVFCLFALADGDGGRLEQFWRPERDGAEGRTDARGDVVDGRDAEVADPASFRGGERGQTCRAGSAFARDPECGSELDAAEGRGHVGDADGAGLEGRSGPVGGSADQRAARPPGAAVAFPPGPDDADGWRRWLAAGGPAPAESGLRRGADGTSARVDKLRLLGNGVVPAQAALAWRVALERLGVRR